MSDEARELDVSGPEWAFLDDAPSPAAEPPEGLLGDVMREVAAWHSSIPDANLTTLAAVLAPLLDRAAKAEAAVARATRLATDYAILGRVLHNVPQATQYAETAFELRRALDGPT